MLSRLVWTVAVLMLLAAPAAAQQAQAPASPEPAAQPPVVDVNRLGVSLHRIGRELQQQPSAREERDGLNLRYIIDVYGQAPRIQIFTPEDNLRYGPTPWSAPTHADMLQMMTPEEFRGPQMDFSALMRWLGSRGKDKR